MKIVTFFIKTKPIFPKSRRHPQKLTIVYKTYRAIYSSGGCYSSQTFIISSRVFSSRFSFVLFRFFRFHFVLSSNFSFALFQQTVFFVCAFIRVTIFSNNSFLTLFFVRPYLFYAIVNSSHHAWRIVSRSSYGQCLSCRVVCVASND